MSTSPSSRMLRKALIVITALLGVILLGPYIGLHVLGTKPGASGGIQEADIAERRTPRAGETTRAADKTALHPGAKAVRSVETPGGKDTGKTEGGLSEIEQLLK